MAVEQVVKMMRYEAGDRVITPEGEGVVVNDEAFIPDNFRNRGSITILLDEGTCKAVNRMLEIDVENVSLLEKEGV